MGPGYLKCYAKSLYAANHLILTITQSGINICIPHKQTLQTAPQGYKCLWVDAYIASDQGLNPDLFDSNACTLSLLSTANKYPLISIWFRLQEDWLGGSRLVCLKVTNSWSWPLGYFILDLESQVAQKLIEG